MVKFKAVMVPDRVLVRQTITSKRCVLEQIANGAILGNNSPRLTEQQMFDTLLVGEISSMALGQGVASPLSNKAM